MKKVFVKSAYSSKFEVSLQHHLFDIIIFWVPVWNMIKKSKKITSSFSSLLFSVQKFKFVNWIMQIMFLFSD